MTDVETLTKTDTESKPFEYWQDWDNYDGMFAYRNAKTIDRYNELRHELGNIGLKRFDMFAAFSAKQFEHGKKSIRPLRDGEKLVSLGAGIFGTKDGIAEYLAYADDLSKRIAQECDPQEVYVFEFNNHESAINFDGDEDAIRIVADLFGWETAKTVKRCCAYYDIEQMMTDKRH